ncbi:MAG: PH domain-containing protein [Candidatus Micrarchaeota archaeon]|nr:PH domain-containing protein [Candidatus Micrarchaeota archaeon]
MEKIRPKLTGYFLTHYFFVIPLAIVLIALALMNVGEMGLFFIFLAVLVLLFSIVHSKAHEMVTSVALEDNKLVHESGIFQHKKNSLPISMVTDSMVTRNPLERVLGVCTLQVNTSGTAAYEVVCDALDFGEAEKINGLLHEMIHGHAGKEKKAKKK